MARKTTTNNMSLLWFICLVSIPVQIGWAKQNRAADSLLGSIDILIRSAKDLESAPSLEKKLEDAIRIAEGLEKSDCKALVERLENASPSQLVIALRILLHDLAGVVRFAKLDGEIRRELLQCISEKMATSKEFRQRILYYALWNYHTIGIKSNLRDGPGVSSQLAMSINITASQDRKSGYEEFQLFNLSVYAALMSYDFKPDEWLGGKSNFYKYLIENKFVLTQDGRYEPSDSAQSVSFIDWQDDKAVLPLPPKPILPDPGMDRELRIVLERLGPLIL